MTIKDKFQQFANKEITAVQLIRDMTCIVNLEHAVDVIALINQVTRVELGDLEMDLFKEMHDLK